MKWPRFDSASPVQGDDRRRVIFVASVAALFLFKLWLVHGEDIIGSATQFDALWYLRSAAAGYWWRRYDWIAFIRPCAYPLWIAAMAWLHIPLRLAIELLQLTGAVVLIAGLRSVGVGRSVCVAAFAVIALHPIGFQLNDYTMSDTFYAGVLWHLLGGLLLMIARANASRAAACGLTSAILWHTREEAVLLIALLFTALCVSVFRGKNQHSPARKTLQHQATCWAVLVAIATTLIMAGYAANRTVYGSFARSEMTAPAFQRLFHSLLRIKPADPKPFPPITMDTLHRAFGVSPTFALLRDRVDGETGGWWRTETERRTGVPGEIGVGWIVWAIRQAASDHSIFKTPASAQNFFKKAAREIDKAIDDGRLTSRLVVDGFNDPLTQTGGLTRVPRSATRVAARIFAKWPVRPIADDQLLTAEETALYNTMTLRRRDGDAHLGGVAAAAEDAIGHYHRLLMIALHFAAVIGVAAAFLAARRLPRNALVVAVVLIGTCVLSRLALFTWLDATAFDATQDRFLFPVLPLWSALLVIAASGIAPFLARRTTADLLKRPLDEVPRQG